jgi:CP family cyanate transporter-like MFS transporter
MYNGGPSGRGWYVLGLGAITVFIVFAMSTACMPVLFSEIAGALGLNIVQVGTVWGLSSVAGIFSILAAGFLADRFGARRIVGAACLLAGVFGALRGFSDGFVSLAVTSLLFGLAGEAVPVIVIKNTSLWFYGRGLGTAQGTLTASVGGGLMLGAMLSATVLSPLLGGWEKVMFFYGAISALVGIVWFVTVPEPARHQDISGVQKPGHALRHVVARRNVLLIAIAMMGFAGCNKGVMGYLPLYLRDNGWTATAADGALAVLNAAGTTAAIPITVLSDRLGLRKSVLIPGLVATIIGVGLFSVFINGPVVWFLAVLSGLFRDLVWAVAATMIVETEGIGVVYAGTAVGLVHAFTRVGYAFAPPSGNSLEAIGAGLPFVFWAGLSLMALIVFLFVKETGSGRNREHATEQ